MAQRVILNLSSGSEHVKDRALKQATTLNQAEITAIFTELERRAKSQEDPGTRTKVLATLIRFVEQRSELQSELVTLLTREPVNLLAPRILPILRGMSNQIGNTSAEESILTVWAEADNTNALVKLAQKRLKEIAGKRN